ncbi:unnamed protein product [Mycena citricolor]|uniref:CobW/HypB/UreG nucleotide-binding domain-containing protein n=1 Tax=Mycena citricolor TaxID=2018698 RepID=A0AAD2H763_9AGAR|nr:unnamed protein product [Mycena citricolor]
MIPITVFTGFLGAGKTSVILSLLPQLPKDYKVVLLKNEFGDVEVDSKLAEQSSLTAVSEILNGCMCCVLVGQMQTALLEIREKFHPDRIIIECSGSAFPATLAFQIRELERQTDGDLKLDAIATVIDAENFTGYEDTSPTAKMQASYTDIILINKWELVNDRKLDTVLDHLHTLNDSTPKIRCRLFLDADTPAPVHNDEVETVSIGGHKHHDHPHEDAHQIEHATEDIDEEVLTGALSQLSKESVWRVKGFIRIKGKGTYILNWAFGRFDLTVYRDDDIDMPPVRLTAMGERGALKPSIRRFCLALKVQLT